MQQCGFCSMLSGLLRRAMCVGSRRGSSESYYRELGDQDTLVIFSITCLLTSRSQCCSLLCTFHSYFFAIFRRQCMKFETWNIHGQQLLSQLFVCSQFNGIIIIFTICTDLLYVYLLFIVMCIYQLFIILTLLCCVCCLLLFGCVLITLT